MLLHFNYRTFLGESQETAIQRYKKYPPFNKRLFGKENQISSRFHQCHATKMLQHPPILPRSHLIPALACQDMGNGYFQALASHSCTQLC